MTAADSPSLSRSPWDWHARVALAPPWVKVPPELADPTGWAAETATRLCADAPDEQRRAALARVLGAFAAEAAASQPMLAAMWQGYGPVAGMTMTSAPLAAGVTDPDQLATTWGRYPTSIGDPEVSAVDLPAGRALRRLDRLPAEPGQPVARKRRSARVSRTRVRELLTYVVFVEPGEALLVKAEWFDLGEGDSLEAQVDKAMATLVIVRH